DAPAAAPAAVVPEAAEAPVAEPVAALAVADPPVGEPAIPHHRGAESGDPHADPRVTVGAAYRGD
ncbi:MAG: hypothetical protein QOI75_2115, partial [Pseudonocardiales bacterium]|nr:hypothetical protein [Pseudonocardiales bacterium]